jgi:hypothetical protein
MARSRCGQAGADRELPQHRYEAGIQILQAAVGGALKRYLDHVVHHREPSEALLFWPRALLWSRQGKLRLDLRRIARMGCEVRMSWHFSRKLIGLLAEMVGESDQSDQTRHDSWDSVLSLRPPRNPRGVAC